MLSAGGGAWAKSHLLLVEEGGISRAQAHEAVSRRGAGSGVAWLAWQKHKHKLVSQRENDLLQRRGVPQGSGPGPLAFCSQTLHLAKI